MRTSRKRGPEARLLGSVALLILVLVASGAGPPRSAGIVPLPSLPLPSLPLPSLPLPSLAIPSLPIPSLPLPSVPALPSLPLPPLPLESVSPPGGPTASAGGGASSQLSPAASGAAADASAAGNAGLAGESPSGGAQPSEAAPFAGPLGFIRLPQLVLAGSAAFLIGLLALYLGAGAGWLAVVRRKLGGMGLRVTAWREERIRRRHPGA